MSDECEYPTSRSGRLGDPSVSPSPGSGSSSHSGYCYSLVPIIKIMLQGLVLCFLSLCNQLHHNDITSRGSWPLCLVAPASGITTNFIGLATLTVAIARTWLTLSLTLNCQHEKFWDCDQQFRLFWFLF